MEDVVRSGYETKLDHAQSVKKKKENFLETACFIMKKWCAKVGSHLKSVSFFQPYDVKELPLVVNFPESYPLEVDILLFIGFLF